MVTDVVQLNVWGIARRDVGVLAYILCTIT